MEKTMIEQKVKSLLEEVQYDDNSDEINVIQIAKDLGFMVGNG